MFLKPKLHKESKMGSKKSIVVATQYYFFQKTIFRQKELSNKFDFCIFMEIYMNKLDQFQKI